ncbi:uncharacterized protein LOC143632929 [Bidens hawaiensis]|uniref:uncharacterized protein LOC143632929 n=1 Tax=Bidens hawaiensis TaxID=980011 RepID=UPI004049423C
MESKIHPTVTVSNIKNFVTITLDNENAQYNTWSELFRIHCTAYLVDDHLQPRPAASSSFFGSVADKERSTADKDKEKSTADKDTGSDQWKRLDAIVLQWIYGTISMDLLQTIMKKNSTAFDAWVALENLFHDNKSSRALHLQSKLTNTRLESFKDMASYCQEIKVLADQISNVDVPLSNTQLVLKVLGGLPEQ